MRMTTTPRQDAYNNMKRVCAFNYNFFTFYYLEVLFLLPNIGTWTTGMCDVMVLLKKKKKKKNKKACWQQ